MRYIISGVSRSHIHVDLYTEGDAPPHARPVPTSNAILICALKDRPFVKLDLVQLLLSNVSSHICPALCAIFDGAVKINMGCESVDCTRATMDALLGGVGVFTYTFNQEPTVVNGPYRLRNGHIEEVVIGQGPMMRHGIIESISITRGASNVIDDQLWEREIHPSVSTITIMDAIAILKGDDASSEAGYLLTVIRNSLRGIEDLDAWLVQRMLRMPLGQLEKVLRALAVGIETADEFNLLIDVFEIKLD